MAMEGPQLESFSYPYSMIDIEDAFVPVLNSRASRVWQLFSACKER